MPHDDDLPMLERDNEFAPVDSPYEFSRSLPGRAGMPQWLKITLIVGVVVVGGLVLIVAAGFLFLWTAKHIPVEEEDRRVVVDAEHIAQYVLDLETLKAHETWTKSKYLDGSYELEYEYDDPADEDFYVTSTVTVERNQSDAITSYVSSWSGIKLGLKFYGESDVQLVPRDDLFRWGDKSEFTTILADGEPIGNAFIGRKGNYVVLWLVSGVIFDDAETIRELLGERLQRVEKYKP